MGKITLELFGRDCEIISYEYKKDDILCFEFTEELSGYIQLDNRVEKLNGKSCLINIRELPVGEHTPRLILEDMTLDLPSLTNENGAIYPSPHTVEEIGSLSLRERRLCRRVNELEGRLEKIENKVFGARIFLTPGESERKQKNENN